MDSLLCRGSLPIIYCVFLVRMLTYFRKQCVPLAPFRNRSTFVWHTFRKRRKWWEVPLTYCFAELSRPLVKMADKKWVDKFVIECFSTIGTDQHTLMFTTVCGEFTFINIFVVWVTDQTTYCASMWRLASPSVSYVPLSLSWQPLYFSSPKQSILVALTVNEK